MADNNVKVESRYLSYNKAAVERILGQVDQIDETPTAGSDNVVKSGGVTAAIETAIEEIPVASESDVRNIVKDWLANPEPEEQVEEEPGGQDGPGE